jgi:PAS domain S-box-containing protein
MRRSVGRVSPTREELLLELERLRAELTARESRELALRESEAQLRSILEHAPNPIVLTDAAGKVLFISRTGPGLRVEDVIGKHVNLYVAPEDRPKVEACMQRVLATGEIGRYEARGQSRHNYAVQVGPVRVGGEIKGLTFVAWDITELRELQARSIINERLASTELLASGLAHEINNPLTYLLANLRWLERDVMQRGPNHDARHWIEAALEGAERIRSIVSDLIGLSRLNQARKAVVDVRTLLDSAVRISSSEIRGRAQLEKLYEDVPPVMANEAQLGQVFVNLLVNAAQAIPAGQADENRIRITVAPTGGDVLVSIEDTGSGIDPAIIDQIFEPFFTTKPAGKGTGLGLSICRSVVTSLGGELRVESRVGAGTTFHVELPSASGRPAAADEPFSSGPTGGSPAPGTASSPAHER